MRSLVRKIHIVIPAAYLFGAAVVWIDFSRLPPDGLANSGIALYTLPVFLVALKVTRREFPFFEGGYYPSHAVYFALSTLFLAALLFLALKAIFARVGVER
jgi:hypothetical protein